MSEMTDKMSEAGRGQPIGDPGVGSPKQGDHFRCRRCGMEIEVTADCRCQGPCGVHFHCCGEELQKMEHAA